MKFCNMNDVLCDKVEQKLDIRSSVIAIVYLRTK